MDRGDLLVQLMKNGSRGIINQNIHNVIGVSQTNMGSGHTVVTEIDSEELTKDVTKGGYADLQIDHWSSDPDRVQAMATAAKADCEKYSPVTVKGKLIRTCKLTGYQSEYEEEKRVFNIRQFYTAYVSS